MKFARKAALKWALAATVLLGGCGGGDGDRAVDNSALGNSGTTVFGVPEGVWGGRFDKGVDPVYQALVQADGSLWIAYGKVAGDGLAVSGFMHGTGVGKNGTFISSELRNYGARSTGSPALMNAAFVPESSFHGSVINNVGTVAFNATPGRTFNYNTPALPASIEGNWVMYQLNGTATTINITAAGDLIGTAGACEITGTVQPSASGKNVYDVTTEFGAGCLPASTAGRGIAIWQAFPESATAQLIIAAVTNDKINGMALIGTR